MPKKKHGVIFSSHRGKIIEANQRSKHRAGEVRNVNVIDQFNRGMEKVSKLNNSSSLIELSKKWLAKANSPQSYSGFSMFLYTSVACAAAEKAYNYEGQQFEKKRVFDTSFFEVSLQKIRAYVLAIIAAGRRDVVEILRMPVDPSNYGLLPPHEVVNAMNELSGQLRSVVEIAFDAEKYKFSLGSDIFPRAILGEDVFENKERYAAEVMEEFKRMIKYMSMSENLKSLLEQVPIEITKTKNDALEVARKLNNKRYGVIVKLVGEALFSALAEVQPSIPICYTLKRLGMFSPADDFEERSGGAEEQKYEVDIHDLIVAYKG